MRRQENLVKVVDPEGQVWEVSQRNATDLIQHKSWTLESSGEPTRDELAIAPRTRRPRGEKVTEARELAARQKAEVEDKVDLKAASELKKVGAKKEKSVKKMAEPVDLGDSSPTFDEQANFDDELADLEELENDRGKR